MHWVDVQVAIEGANNEKKLALIVCMLSAALDSGEKGLVNALAEGANASPPFIAQTLDAWRVPVPEEVVDVARRTRSATHPRT